VKAGDEVLWINESFGLNDAGHIIMTSYVDLRKPEDRTPIKSLVRAIAMLNQESGNIAIYHLNHSRLGNSVMAPLMGVQVFLLSEELSHSQVIPRTPPSGSVTMVVSPVPTWGSSKFRVPSRVLPRS
jgi:hypothetical protein